MGHQLICNWLDLSADCWPPDHYSLLGLPKGESDAARIERHVQERLERIRQWQLAHPEPATEAMNRLAQAFICLTDPGMKRAYDASLLGRPAEVAAASTAPASVERAASAAPAPRPLDWRATPPPPRNAPAEAGPTVPAEPAAPTLQDAATVETTPAVPVPLNPAELEYLWQPLQRGLATRRALLDRLLLVRQLLHSWRAAGKYLRKTQRPLSRPSEATDLIQLMERIRRLQGALPGLLGEAGRPGYLVGALARQPLIVPTIQTLQPSQRAALARDWQHGLALLTAHLDWLRRDLRAHRRRNTLTRSVRSVFLLLRDRPGFLLFALGLVALNLVPAFRERLFEQVVILLGLAAFRLFLWWDARTTVRRVRAHSRHSISPGKQPRSVPR